MPQRSLNLTIIGTLALLGAAPALAQVLPIPDAGRILQETRPAPERRPEVTLPPLQSPAQPKPVVPAGAGDVRVNVTHFEFSGNNALSNETLRAAVAAWSGRALNFGELIEAVEAVEAAYKTAGYFLAQGYLPPQKIKDGAIEIAVTEGRLGETRLEGESRVNPDVLFAYLDRLPKGRALTLPILERQVLLINELAGGRASLDMQAGEEPGSTDIVLAQQPEEATSGRFELNNHGSPSTGGKRQSLNVNANSPFHLGERITASVMNTDTNKLISYNLRGELPVGGAGWRLIAGASRAEYSLGGSFAALNANGQADSWRLGAGYPFIRSRAANLKLNMELDRTKLLDRFRAAGTETAKQSHGLSMTLGADTIDEWMGGGSSRAELALRTARLTLDPTAAATDAPPAGLGTAGRFNKISLTAQRQQSLNRDWGLQANLQWQMSDKNLDSSEKLVLGGPTIMPGYANGEASGDSGVLAKLALRWQALPEVALSVFADYGRLKLSRDALDGVSKNDKRLSDSGLSVDWLIGKGFNASAIIAWAGQEAPNTADNAQPRMWFSVGYGW